MAKKSFIIKALVLLRKQVHFDPGTAGGGFEMFLYWKWHHSTSQTVRSSGTVRVGESLAPSNNDILSACSITTGWILVTDGARLCPPLPPSVHLLSVFRLTAERQQLQPASQPEISPTCTHTRKGTWGGPYRLHWNREKGNEKEYWM